MPTIEEWLISLNLEEWIDNFIYTGYDDFENVLLQMTTDDPITIYTLENDIKIYDQTVQRIICSKLLEGKIITYFNFSLLSNLIFFNYF